MTFATGITLLRILLVPLFAGALLYHQESHLDGYVGNGWYLAAVLLFALAAFSDGIDGWIARHFNQRSTLGRILDPVADKLLLVTAAVLLGTVGVAGKGRLPLWFPVLVVSRDLLLVAGTLLVGTLIHHYHFVRPHWTGKASTFFQIAAILLGLLFPGENWIRPVIWAAGAVTLISMGVYVVKGWKLLHTSTYGEPSRD